MSDSTLGSSRSSVLVTGAAGFIGSHLVDRLLADGHCVIGVDNFSRGTEANIANARRNSSFRFVRTDLANEDQIMETLVPAIKTVGISRVWHMAANSDIAAGVLNAEVDLRDTFLTTFNILKLMRNVGASQIA